MRLTKQKSDDFALQMNEDRLTQIEGQGEQQASRGTAGATQTTPIANRVDFCTDHSRGISSLFSTLPLVRQRIR